MVVSPLCQVGAPLSVLAWSQGWRPATMPEPLPLIPQLPTPLRTALATLGGSACAVYGARSPTTPAAALDPQGHPPPLIAVLWFFPLQPPIMVAFASRTTTPQRLSGVISHDGLRP